MPDVKFGIDASGATSGAASFKSAADTVARSANAAASAVAKIAKQAKRLSDLAAGSSVGAKAVNAMLHQMSAAAKVQNIATKATASAAKMQREQNRDVAVGTRRFRSFQSTLGGSRRAAAQFFAAIAKLNVALKTGAINAKTYSQGIRDARKTFTTANINAKDLRRNMSGLNAKMNQLGKLSTILLGPLSGVGSRLVAISSLARSAGLGIAAVAGSIGIFVAGIVALKRAAAKLDEIGKIARAAGLAATALQELRFVAERSGVATTQLDNAMLILVKRLGQAAGGTGQARRALKTLKLTLADLNGLTPDKALERIAKEFVKIRDPARRASVAADLFSRANQKMVNVLGLGPDGIRKLREEFVKLGAEVGNKGVADAEKFEDALTNLQKSAGGVFRSIVITMAPTITLALRGLTILSSAIKKLPIGRVKDFVNAFNVPFILAFQQGAARAAATLAKTAAERKAILAQASRDVDKILSGETDFASFISPALRGVKDSATDASSGVDALALSFDRLAPSADIAVGKIDRAQTAFERFKRKTADIAFENAIALQSPLDKQISRSLRETEVFNRGSIPESQVTAAALERARQLAIAAAFKSAQANKGAVATKPSDSVSLLERRKQLVIEISRVERDAFGSPEQSREAGLISRRDRLIEQLGERGLRGEIGRVKLAFDALLSRDALGESIKAVESWRARFTDTLADALGTGKLQFKDFARSAVQDLAKIFINQTITQPLFDDLTRGLAAIRAGTFGAEPATIGIQRSMDNVGKSAVASKDVALAGRAERDFEHAAKTTQTGFKQSIDTVTTGFGDMIRGVGILFAGVAQSFLGLFGGGGPDLSVGGFFKLLGRNVAGGVVSAGVQGVANSFVPSQQTRIPASQQQQMDFFSQPNVFDEKFSVSPVSRPFVSVAPQANTAESTGGITINVPVNIPVASLDPGTAAAVIQANMPIIESGVRNAIERGGGLARSVGRRR